MTRISYCLLRSSPVRALNRVIQSRHAQRCLESKYVTIYDDSAIIIVVAMIMLFILVDISTVYILFYFYPSK